MNLFLENGHLAPDAYTALGGEGLPELERLEASEHLGFCDACMDHYLDVLNETELMVPQMPVASAMQRRIRRRFVGVTFQKYATVAAAACLVVALWASGFFKMTPLAPTAATQPAQAAAQPEQTLGERMNNFASQVSDGVNGFFIHMFAPTPPQENTAPANAKPAGQNGTVSKPRSTGGDSSGSLH